jgi:acetyltransferase-like isoleucine patch superfamily enzyme
MKKVIKIIINNLGWPLIRSIPFTRVIYETRFTQTPVPILQYLLFRAGLRRNIYWPTHHSSLVVGARNIHIGIETSPGIMPGCYIQGTNGIIIGDYTQMAANVSLISANHSLTDNRAHLAALPIKIGNYCWIGTHSVILPGVELGEYTIIGAGSVVTKSFPDGYQVLMGNPARVSRRLNPSECDHYHSEFKYNGFIKNSKFKQFIEKHLTQAGKDLRL